MNVSDINAYGLVIRDFDRLFVARRATFEDFVAHTATELFELLFRLLRNFRVIVAHCEMRIARLFKLLHRWMHKSTVQ